MDDTNNSGGLVSRLTAFLKRPFQEEMGAGQWVLFTILVVTVAVFWCRILSHIDPTELVEG